MRIRSLSSVAPTAIGLSLCVLISCSERRSTGPGEPPGPPVSTKLPALSVNDDPIVALSDTIWGGREVNDLYDLGYGINLRRPDDPAFDRMSDVMFGYGCSFTCADVHVYDPRDSVWVQIDAPWNNQICPPTWETNWTSKWLLSEIEVGLDEIMEDDGRLHVGGNGFRHLYAQFVRCHDDYRCIRVGRNEPSHAPWIEISALTWGDGKIWIAVAFVEIDRPRHATDSIWAFDSTGARVVAYEHDLGKVWGLEYYGGELLALADGNRTLVALDEDGNVTRSMHWDYDMADMTIAMGRLWLPNPTEQSLRGFVLDSAFWQGNTRIDWNFHIPGGVPYCSCVGYPRDCNCLGIAWDGSYFYFQTAWSVSKVNLSNQIVGRFQLRVAAPMRLAWDGEAAWIVHQGPPETRSTTLWLSRFRLP